MTKTGVDLINIAKYLLRSTWRLYVKTSFWVLSRTSSVHWPSEYSFVVSIEWKWLKCFPGCNVDWLTQQWTFSSGGQGRRDKFWYFHSCVSALHSAVWWRDLSGVCITSYCHAIPQIVLRQLTVDTVIINILMNRCHAQHWSKYLHPETEKHGEDVISQSEAAGTFGLNTFGFKLCDFFTITGRK